MSASPNDPVPDPNILNARDIGGRTTREIAGATIKDIIIHGTANMGTVVQPALSARFGVAILDQISQEVLDKLRVQALRSVWTSPLRVACALLARRRCGRWPQHSQ
jgi:hypothetical protein